MLRRLRDRLYSNPRFQRWAAAFPLTRGIARRNAAAVFDLTAGFVYSRVLEVCLRLDLLEALREGPRTSAELAASVGLPVEGCERLLAAAAGVELVEARRGGGYGLGRLGAMVLGHPGLKPMVAHHRLFHRDLEHLLALLRGEAEETELGAFWSYAGEASSDEGAEGYSALMGDSLAMLVEDVLEAHPMERHRHLMDVGGGDGSFLRAVGERHPDLELTLFDLPAVARQAAEHCPSSIHIAEGDLFQDALPRGADCITLVRILLDHDDHAALAILRAARCALDDGGTLIVAEAMSGTGVPRVADTYFGLYLLAMGQGRTRTPEEIGDLLKTAGFRTHRSVTARRSELCHLIVATA